MIVAQVLGLAGFFLEALAYWAKNTKGILVIQGIAKVFFLVSYLLLGAYAGAVVKTLAICYVVALTTGQMERVVSLLVLSYAEGAVLLYDTPLSLLPFICGLAYMFAAWRWSTQSLRLVAVGTSLMYLIYDVVVFSLGGILTDVFTIISIIGSFAKRRLDE